MKDIMEKIKERKRKKKRKPKYIRQDWWKKSRLGRRRKKKQKWRRPKGRHSKVRLRRKGKPKRPEVGYGSPKEVKGTIKGLRPILVKNIKDLEGIDKEKEIAIISANIGKRKKIEILKKCLELGLKTNINIEKFFKKVEEEKKVKEIVKEEEKKKEEEKRKEEEEKVKEKEEIKEEEEKEKKEIEKKIEKEKEELKKIVETKREKISKAKEIKPFRMSLEK